MKGFLLVAVLANMLGTGGRIADQILLSISDCSAFTAAGRFAAYPEITRLTSSRWAPTALSKTHHCPDKPQFRRSQIQAPQPQPNTLLAAVRHATAGLPELLGRQGRKGPTGTKSVAAYSSRAKLIVALMSPDSVGQRVVIALARV